MTAFLYNQTQNLVICDIDNRTINIEHNETLSRYDYSVRRIKSFVASLEGLVGKASFEDKKEFSLESFEVCRFPPFQIDYESSIFTSKRLSDFPELQIRGIFTEFIGSIFAALDLSKHLFNDFTNETVFKKETFLEESDASLLDMIKQIISTRVLY